MPARSAIIPDRGSPATTLPTREIWRQDAAAKPGTLLFECTAAPSAVDPAETATLLFTDPRQTFTAHTAKELTALLESLETALADGFYIAGYLTYEAACILEGSTSLTSSPEPLAWFGVYTAPDRLQPSPETPALDHGATLPLCFELDTERGAYLDGIAEVQQLIANGDTYQVNLTNGVTSSFRGNVASLYTAIAHQQPTAFSALLHPASGLQVLSFSPELLFRIEPGGRIVTRPMKGTAPALPRALETADNVGDSSASAHRLQTDEKNRAEHVMIVDLLRNDLNRVAITGSVHVDPLFAVERYNSLLQMTSTVVGQLRPDVGLGEILRALLPPGSMTGAPKRRTMQIIDRLETHKRGVYSGTIGFAAPDGTAVFSVPIRTLVLDQDHLHMGVGAGIVADSKPEDELAECWHKCAFLHRASTPFELVETFRWDGARLGTAQTSAASVDLTCANAEDHLDRLRTSAHCLGFDFDRTKLLLSLRELASTLPKPQRIRLLLDRTGTVRFEVLPLDLWPDTVAMRFSPEIVWSADTFLRHKTTYRPIYNRELSRARDHGFADALFVNERGELTEGAISSLFLLLDGRWVTPNLSSGLLPGVARTRLFRIRQVTEYTLTEADLRCAAAVVAANGVRGAVQVRRIQMRSGQELQYEAIADFPRS